MSLFHALLARLRGEQGQTFVEYALILAVVVVGVPFGHTRPQWILPYGGTMTVDGVERRVWADYD